MVSTALPYQCPRPLSFVLVAPIGGMFVSASLGRLLLLRVVHAILPRESYYKIPCAHPSEGCCAWKNEVQQREKGAKIMSKMAISGAKRLVSPWFQKCILYLDMKAILYYTSSTIGDDRSSENRQKGPSFLLMKRLAGKKTCTPWYDGYVSRRRRRGCQQVPCSTK
jgi:hypothetical protein